MDNQHRQISGYRELSQAEIDLINEIKAHGEAAAALVEKVKRHLHGQVSSEPSSFSAEAVRIHAAEPQRWAALGKTHLQEGVMALTRAVAQPTGF